MREAIPKNGLPDTTSDLGALLADLGVLDTRLRAAVERLRAGLPAAADTTVRGLLIEESDVDPWLGALDSMTGPPGADAAPFCRARPDGRLAQLGDLFGLGRFERGVLLTALAPEIDLAYGNLYAYVQDDVTRKYATVDLALTLWCGSLAERLAARAYFSADALLRRHLLLISTTGRRGPARCSRARWCSTPAIVAYLLGADRPDPALGRRGDAAAARRGRRGERRAAAASSRSALTGWLAWRARTAPRGRGPGYLDARSREPGQACGRPGSGRPPGPAAAADRYSGAAGGRRAMRPAPSIAACARPGCRTR